MLSRPDPSTSTTPSVEMFRASRTAATDCRPATRVGDFRLTSPISLRRSSAALLSLFASTSARRALNGAEVNSPTFVPSLGASPLRGAAITVIPRACSKRVNAVAAPTAGLAGLKGSPSRVPSSTIRALSGPASMARMPSPHVGTYRSSSYLDSSPTTEPVTLLMPLATNSSANASRNVGDVVG